MDEKTRSRQLVFGPDTAISYANIEDYSRFNISCPGHVEWGYRWIKERLSLDGPVGVFQHSNKGFTFDTYVPLPQSNYFYNVITSPGCFFSSLYVRTKSESLDKMKDKNYYSDICCPLQLHVLSEEMLKIFINKSVVSLIDNGNLILSFNLWLGCDSHSKEVLKNSSVLLKNNKQVSYTSGIRYQEVRKHSKKLKLAISVNEKETNCSESKLEELFLSDDRLVFQHSRSVFKENYTNHENKYLQVADTVKSMAGCLWLKKAK